MAGSRFAYVRSFELPDPVLPAVYMVVRIDGKGFHRFSQIHAFQRPNDAMALELMNQAARHVCDQLRGDVTLAFGESDEYSFLLRKTCKLYNRRESKIVTHIVSLFTSAYVFYWSQYFPHKPLQHPPSFDGRLVAYPGVQEVKDYFAWRQADTHINNLYNTTFWALVLQGGQTERQAHETLKGTVSAQKNEILFSRFGINYERLPAMFRKGTTVVWTEDEMEEDRGEAQSGDLPGIRVEGKQDVTHTRGTSGTNVSNEQGEQAGMAGGGSQSLNRTSPSSSSSSCSQPHAGRPSRAKSRTHRHPPRKLRTLHVDIIRKSFWEEPTTVKSTLAPGKGPHSRADHPADGEVAEAGARIAEQESLQSLPRSATAPAETDTEAEAASPASSSTAPWDRLERVQGYAGLGRWALR